MPEIETAKQARQGPKGKPVLYVLIGSLVLLAIYMVGLLTWSGSTSPPDHAGQSTDAARKEVTGSTSGQSNAPSPTNSSNVPAGNPATPAPAQPKAN